MLRGVHASGPEPGESAISLQNKLDGESERRDTSELLDVLVRAGLPRVSVLMELGVRRVSAGSGISSAVHGLTRRAVRQFLDGGTYDAMLDGAMPYGEVNALFGERT